ncbi:hypothetical protein ACHHYP_03485 [Achlya hypogyna]|uniref:Secreted protein n=1 Tax=Achlya hypogyna TaxID=1202772 RepID=A0A1V9Z3P5_ACHHY|nr:hypothetical protein ACHHYP_03485 [Achlya hypogyna]
MTLGRAVAGLLTIASVAVSQDIVAMALTPPPVPRMYSPSNANISVYLGNNISVADFVETKTVLLNLLADMMGVARTAVHVAYLDTPVFDRLTRGRLTVDLTVDLTVPWVCSDSRVVAATLHLPASFTSLDATTACNDLAVSSCGNVCTAVGPSVWNPTAQVQRITQGLTAGYTFKTMDGSSRWLTLQDVNGYFGLFPHSIESFTLEAPTSPALFSSTYLAARVVLAGAVDGTDAIEVAFALAATLRSSALAVQAENFRSFPLEAVPAAVYGRSDAWLLDVTIAEASTVRRTSIASVLQTGKWQALLPTTKVLAYDVNSDASQPVAQAAAKSYPAASLVVTLGCPLSLMQLTSNMTTFVAGISAALPNWLVLETPINDSRPLFMDVLVDDQVDPVLPGRLTLVMPVLPTKAAAPGTLDAGFVMRLQLAWWATPLFCNTFPKVSLKPPVASSQTFYATLSVQVRLTDPPDPFVLYRIKQAMFALVSPLDIKYSDLILLSAAAGEQGRSFELYIYYYTINQQHALAELFPSEDWSSAFAKSMGGFATLLATDLTVPTTTSFATASYPGTALTSVGVSSVAAVNTTKVVFTRPAQKYLFSSFTGSNSNGEASTDTTTVVLTSGFEYNAFYLDAISFASSVWLNSVPPLSSHVAPIVLSNGTTVWTLEGATGGDVACCLHLKQVYDTADAADALVICITTTGTEAQVTMQNNRPKVVDAAYSASTDVVVTLRDVAATEPYGPSASCSPCYESIQTCRADAACRDFVQCLTTTPAINYEGSAYAWSPSLLTALQLDGEDAAVSVLPVLEACTMALNFTTAASIAGGAKYFEALRCLSANFCPLNWFSFEHQSDGSSGIATAVRFVISEQIIQDAVVVANNTPIALEFKLGTTLISYANYTPGDAGALQAFLQAQVLATFPSLIAPTLFVTQNGPTLSIQYVALPSLDAYLPTLDGAERSVAVYGSISAVVKTYDASMWVPTLGSATQRDMLWTVNQCMPFDLNSAFLSGSDYIGHLALKTEAQLSHLIATLLPTEASTCMGSVPGAQMNTAVETIFNDRDCAAWLTYPWASLLNMSSAAALKDAYSTGVCPLYAAHGKACIENVLVPTITSIFVASGGCCAPFEAIIMANYSSDVATLLVNSSQLVAAALCTLTPAEGQMMPCSAAILACVVPTVAPAWFAPILWALQVPSDAATALWAGALVTTTNNRTFRLYDPVACTLDRCAAPWNELFSWLGSLPLWAIYPISDDNLTNLFAWDACLQGPHLLQFANDLFDAWHQWPQSWSVLDYWTNAFYANLDYLYSTWMQDACYHLANGLQKSSDQ